MPCLQAAGEARVISLSSSAHRRSDIHYEDPKHNRRHYDPAEAYGQSKTANALFVVGFSATGSSGPGSASLTFTENPEVSPGLWFINPDEIGPYPPSGIPTDTASASLLALTETFDPAVTSSTGNLWDGSLSNFLYLMPGRSGTIEVDVSPTGKPGTEVSGTLYVDDLTLGQFSGVANTDGDELAAIPYEYTTG
jgi:hypothetical protein